MKNNTKSAFISLLIPAAHIAVFLIFATIANLLERYFEINGFYLFFSLTATVLLAAFPIVAIIVSIRGIVYSARAIRCGENQGVNAAIILVCASCIIFSIYYAAGLLQSILSA